MKKTLIIIAVLFVGIVAFLTTRINRENLDYSSSYPMLNTTELLQQKGTYLAIIFSSNCSGTTEQFPSIGEKLDALKKKNIPYYLIADEIYNDKVDENLDDIKKRYHLENETFYLMDTKEFPTNGGLFHDKERYEHFTTKITNGKKVPLGYVNFIIIKDNELQSSSPTLTLEKINQFK